MKCRNRADQAGTKQGCKHSQYTFMIQNFLSFPNPSIVYNRRVIIASIKTLSIFFLYNFIHFYLAFYYFSSIF